jgi:hypothetical protein
MLIIHVVNKRPDHIGKLMLVILWLGEKGQLNPNEGEEDEILRQGLNLH